MACSRICGSYFEYWDDDGNTGLGKDDGGEFLTYRLLQSYSWVIIQCVRRGNHDTGYNKLKNVYEVRCSVVDSQYILRNGACPGRDGHIGQMIPTPAYLLLLPGRGAADLSLARATLDVPLPFPSLLDHATETCWVCANQCDSAPRLDPVRPRIPSQNSGRQRLQKGGTIWRSLPITSGRRRSIGVTTITPTDTGCGSISSSMGIQRERCINI